MAFPQVGTNTTLTMTGFTFVVTNIDWSGLSRTSVETTPLNPTNNARTFIPGDLYDPGTLEVELQWDPALSVPIDLTDTEQTCTIDWAGEASTWAAKAFLTDFSISAPLEDLCSATATLKFTDQITGL